MVWLRPQLIGRILSFFFSSEVYSYHHWIALPSMFFYTIIVLWRPFAFPNNSTFFWPGPRVKEGC